MEARNVYCFDVKENLGMDDDQKKVFEKKEKSYFHLCSGNGTFVYKLDKVH
jgi:hypothetical protein